MSFLVDVGGVFGPHRVLCKVYSIPGLWSEASFGNDEDTIYHARDFDLLLVTHKASTLIPILVI